MAEYNFDLIVIGSGPGGYIAAIQAAMLGLRVACVEKEKNLGGTCLNVGCIPSKALLQSSEYYAWLLKSSHEHGIEAKDVSLNFETMMKRKEEIVKGLVGGISTLFKQHKISRFQGTAKFIDAHTIEITNDAERKNITAGNFIIATGSEPIALPFLPFDEKQVISSTGALSLPSIPKRLLVVGAGVIGVELASVYRRVGSEVTIVEMLDGITPAMDQAISKQLLQILKKQGMNFYLGAKVSSGKASANGVKLEVEYEQKLQTMEADVVLVAVGRRPYTKGLGIETIGITADKRGFIPVDTHFRTTAPHIYAIGDVIDGPMLAHRASHEGIAAANIIAGLEAHVNYMGIPNVIYTHPEAAAVGFTESEAKTSGLDVFVGTSFFRGNGRARCSGDTDGFVKVIGEKVSGRLVGMHIIGAHASELIAEGMLAIDKKATVKELANSCHAHPTLSETIMEACQQAQGH